MTPDSFPDREPDGEEPDGSGPLPAGNGPEDDGQEPAQGLFVCLPAEELTLSGFAQDGRADTMAPGALLATLLDAIVGEGGSGLAGLADDQLIGIISAARRIESRTAWTLMAALAELARRRPADGPCDSGQLGFSDFAADEVAAELHLTNQSAADQIWYARDVAARLPCSFAALAAGQLHPRPPADHPGRDGAAVPRRHRDRRCDAGRGGRIADVRAAAVQGAPASPHAGPGRRPAAQGGRQAGRARVPIP